MSAEKRARELDGGEYERALADSLRQLADAEWSLSGEPMPQDARQALNSAAAMLVMNRSIMDTGLTTIRIQSQLIEAIGNEIRAAGCEFDPVTGAVVNPAALTPQWADISTAPRDGTAIIGFSPGIGCPILIRWVAPQDFMTTSECERHMDGCAENEIEEAEKWLETPAWWCADFTAGDMLADDCQPTKWLPLPAPPEGEA